MVRRLFGSQSEQLDPAQLQMLLQGVENANPRPSRRPRPNRRWRPNRPRRVHLPGTNVRPGLPEHLPVVEEVLDPEPVRACPERVALHRPGDQRATRLRACPLPAPSAHPPQVRAAWRGGCHPGHRAPAAVLAGARPAHGRAARPGAHRQVLPTIFLFTARRRSTASATACICPGRPWLAGWAWPPTGCGPIYDAIRTGVLAGGYVQVDETPIAYLEPGHGSTRARVTCGRTPVQAATCSLTGRQAVGPNAWNMSSAPALAARCNAMGTRRIPRSSSARPVRRQDHAGGLLGACPTQVP